MKSKYFMLIMFAILASSCVELQNFSKAKITKPGRILTSYNWELENITGETGNQSIRFDLGTKGKELSFSKTYGAGRFQRIAIGIWEFDKKDKSISFYEFDPTEGAFLPEEKYKLIEISNSKFVISKLNDKFEFKATPR